MCREREALKHLVSLKVMDVIKETLSSNGNPLTYMDIISCEDTIADDIDKKIKSAKALRVINNRLTDRERTIIVLRYGLGDIKPVTQREIAAKLGISRSYVSRIEKAALDKIYEALEGTIGYEM